MIRTVLALTFLGAIVGVASNIVDYTIKLGWSFGFKEEFIIKQSKEERSLCDSKECYLLAKILKDSMNETVDPCEDFYEYACGNWKVHNPLPENEISWNLLAKSRVNVEERLKALLMKDTTPDDLFSTKLLKRAYKACMNIDEIEKRGLQPLVSTVWRIGGWPLIMEEDEWHEEMYKWQRVDDYYARLTGFNSLHDIRIGKVHWDDEQDGLLIDTPHLPYGMYKLLTQEEYEMDSSDENNDSGEGSQEQGSEEKRDSNENEDEENDEEDDDGEAESRKKKLTIKARINKPVGRQREKDDKNKMTRKHTREHRMKKKTRRATTDRKVHTKKLHGQRKTSNRRVHRTKRMTERLPKHRRMIHHMKESTEHNNLRSKAEYDNSNSGLYFDDTDGEGSNVNAVANQKRYNVNVEDDEDNDAADGDTDDNEEYGSGSGDDEGDDENGSGDDEGDYESGSGSGDDEGDDENGSGDDEGDYESGSGSGDDEGDDENGSGDDEGDYETGRGDGDGDDDEDRKRREEDRKRTLEFRQKYKKYIVDVALAIAEAREVLVPREKLENDVDDLIQFQTAFLRLIDLSRGEIRNITLQSFQQLYNSFNPTTNNGKVNWIKKVEEVFATGGMEIESDIVVLVPSISYFKDLRRLLDKTPSRTIVNYVHWSFLTKVMKATTREMRDLYRDWRNMTQIKTPRSEYCIDDIKAKYTLGFEYVKEYFPDSALQTASDMVDDIQNEVRYQIKESAWMDNDTKHFILDKLVYMKKIIGYPVVYRNTSAMNQLFRGVSVSKSHYENVLAIMRYVKWSSLQRINLDDRFYGVHIDPLMVNAFFSAVRNSVMITAADFQSPLFDPRQPWYTNFGIIGFIMAHEVNHGFDNYRYKFDKQGKFFEWLTAMAAAYKERAKCFEDQFTKYSVAENNTANVPIKNYGKQTSGENIADTMGLQAVFRAYQQRQRKCKQPDPMLPGFEKLSNEQMFFLSFAQLWCEVRNPDFVERTVKRDAHSPGPLRIIGSVSNSEDFAKTFNCPENSPMNPKKKCNIWK